MYNLRKEKVKNIFYEIVEAGKVGGIFTNTGVLFVRFDYFLNGKLYNEDLSERYYGKEDIDKNTIFEYEESNGTSNYIPSLIVNNEEKFINELSNCITKYIKLYNLDKKSNFELEENSYIKELILIILSNARYTDFLYPIQYLKKIESFIDDKTLYYYFEKIYLQDLELFNNSNIVINNKIDLLGYETPYAFEIYFEKDTDKYYLPVINYGIKDNICYIYSIQNKIQNDNNTYQKKIKRLLYKMNDIINKEKDKEYLPTPSFILSLAVFLKILNKENINEVRGTTFLPYRYFEKKACNNKKTDIIQNNLTQKLINLFYIENMIFPNTSIIFPMIENVTNEDYGEDIVLNINNLDICNNSIIDTILKNDKAMRK